MVGFEQSKQTMLLLVTVFVLIIVAMFFFVILGNYKVGSDIDVKHREVELVAFRVIKCLENGKQLDTCLKTNKYGASLEYKGVVNYLNEELYDKYHVENLFIVDMAKGQEVWVAFRNE